ncbi:response regulator [Anaerobium acetethylicum]|uniref:Stage 0 sporulation protein A homolog n=1 Tax=Anaerobium acetethylicum TaxID=1619234 RepID=A0A1D3TSU1_9FIRM|nr:response regulator transcription factor [Anaerobium acetethylicum]SCP96975.1 two-component system, NarL family, response regulator YdfI [Anaerobium acetethylicum]
MEQYRILIVDDHPIVREGLKLIFETEKSIIIEDEASNGAEALALVLAETNKFDLILLDISMPVMDGITFLEQLKDRGISINTMVLTTSDDADDIQAALQAGAKSVLLKDAARKEMIQTVLRTAKGESVLQPELQHILQAKRKLQQDSLLTPKELSVLGRIVKGSASKEIALDMGISERTVKAHLSSIYQKLDVGSRAEAVACAIVRKLVTY